MTIQAIKPQALPQRLAASFLRIMDAPSTSAQSRPATLLSRVTKWVASHKKSIVDPHRLHVAERVSIGEKTFLTVVQVDGRRFFISNGQAGVSLLAELDRAETFDNTLEKIIAMKPSVRRPRSKTAVAKGTAK